MERRPLILVNGKIQELPLTDWVPGEENIMYSKRVDFVGTDVIYRAEAFVGAAENSPVWRIRKIDISSTDSDVSEKWANGSSSFEHIWSDRLTYTYI